jgi:hypothetical protein
VRLDSGQNGTNSAVLFHLVGEAVARDRYILVNHGDSGSEESSRKNPDGAVAIELWFSYVQLVGVAYTFEDLALQSSG